MSRYLSILLTLLSTASLALAGAVSAAFASPEGRITVGFVEPQRFTDARYTTSDHNSAALLAALQTFMRETGERYVPAGMQLEITVTDIDLAGAFEPWRGPQFGHVRIIRDIYPPRLSLAFRLTDGSGQVVSTGTRELRNIAYQMRIVRPLDDYLRYEKDMLRDWLRSEFKGMQSVPARVRIGATDTSIDTASFDRTRHVATPSFVQPKGHPWPPRR